MGILVALTLRVVLRIGRVNRCKGPRTLIGMLKKVLNYYLHLLFYNNNNNTTIVQDKVTARANFVIICVDLLV